MSETVIIQCDQGSFEWYQARAGAITASMFSVAREKVGGLDQRQAQFVDLVRQGAERKEAAKMAGYKSAPSADRIERAIAGEKVGEPSNAALDYAFRLAVERISGEPLDEGFQTWQMRRGNELEPAARSLHALLHGLTIERAGLVKTADGKFGASADGLIGKDGGSEYKCFVSPEKLRTILMDGDISTVRDQVQGCLWLTGREWWHFALYCPALEPCGKELIVHHVKRDNEYIAALEADLLEFDALVESYVARLREGSA